MTHIRVEVPDELAARLSELATVMRSTPEALLLQAVEDLVAARDDIRARIERGMADIAAGRTVPHEQVMAEMEAMIDEAERRAPK
jgi:predicted transcriptional regulator